MLSMPRIVRPDPSSFLGRNLVPPLDRQPCRSIKRNKELSNLLSGKSASQVGNHSPPNCELDQLPFPNQNRSPMDFSSILWTLVIGLVVGAIAKLLMPGKDPGGFIITMLLGIAGAFVGTWLGRLFAGENYVAGWIMSIIGAMILLLLYRLILKRRM
jgi:uncharacterized membrane protein YeaQ/YmgE (transglycosylase-associated protein family)